MRAGESARARVVLAIAMVAMLSLAIITPMKRAAARGGSTSARHDAAQPVDPQAANPALRRYPYLTDLVGRSVTVSWMTDRSAAGGSALWGAVGGDGSCTPTNPVGATRVPLTVNGVATYQWAAALSLPQPGTYCYRVQLAGTDLLGSNPSPRFTTQVPAGSAERFSFAVFGDWGASDASGQNAGQTGVMREIARSGVRFAVANGDTAYDNGDQNNYGDLQTTGTNISDVFGPQFWTLAGSSVPLFNTLGNHGLARSDTYHPFLVNWPASQAVTGSGGRYQRDVYCCVNGTSSQTMASAWYAFDAGNARFYALDAAWPDSNPGNADGYANDYAAHWTPGSPEYEWLKNDLATHPSQLKFAFVHYPPYTDQMSEHSDPYLRGPDNLEGLLAGNGVDLLFGGHSHIYERNTPAYPGGLITYVSGGGGGTLQSIGAAGCSSWDAYGIGWSTTQQRGNACGSAPTPSSPGQVFHFLKVTVDGSTVTVAPTDSNGNTFDVRTYTFPGSTTTTSTSTTTSSTTTSSSSTTSSTTTTVPSPPLSAIQQRYQSSSYLQSLLGAPVGAELVWFGVHLQNYQRGVMYWTAQTGAHEVHGGILQQLTALGGVGVTGLPLTDETGTPDGVGRYNHFSNDYSIYWTPQTGAHEVHGAIRAKWAALGWERSLLGYPTTDETATAAPGGRYNNFVGGTVIWSAPTGAHEIHGAIYQEFLKAGATGLFGFPTTDELGTPDGAGRFNHFSGSFGASIYWMPQTGAHEVQGAIRARWAALGWERSYLGYPVSDEYGVAGGRRSDFQHGSIVWNAATGQVTDFHN